MRRQTSGADPERVGLRLRRVVVGRVERGEVVVLELDLGALGDAEAEPDEDVLDLALDLRQQMRRAARDGVARQRHVDRLGAQRGVELARLELLAQLRVQPLELAAHAVQLLAARSAQLGRQGAELAQRERQRARAPERLDACVLELRGRRGPLELFAPLAFQAGRVLHGLPRVDAGTRETPPRYHPACAVPAPLAFRRSTASRPAREVNFGGPSARGLSVTAPLPVEDGARLLVSVGAGAAILPPVRRGAAAPGGEPYERLGPLYDRWCAGVDHDIPFYVLACEGAAGPIIELGRRQRAHRGRARPARPPRDRARRGARDARPGASAARGASTSRLRDRPRRPARSTGAAAERPRDRALPDVHAPHRGRRAPARPERRRRPARPRAGGSSSTSSSPAPPTSAPPTTAGSRAARASASGPSGTPRSVASSWTCASRAASCR